MDVSFFRFYSFSFSLGPSTTYFSHAYLCQHRPLRPLLCLAIAEEGLPSLPYLTVVTDLIIDVLFIFHLTKG
jgi:hypothetical protein